MQDYTEEPIRKLDEGEHEFLNNKDRISFADHKEKQISVDPLSLKPLWLPPPPLPLPKFVSCSLPSSALSSPTNASAVPKQSYRFEWETTNSLRLSKSCGEGRSSSPSVVEFIEILSRRPSIRAQDGDQSDDAVKPESSEDGHGNSVNDDRFKCRCLFLPGLSNKKKREPPPPPPPPLQLLNQRVAVPLHQASVQEVRTSTGLKNRVSTVSKAASLEKFSCGSWSSSALLESDDGRNSYYDLPLELIRGGGNETDSPVRAAFVFDREVKGVLKKSSSNVGTSRKSHASSSSNRHVRFSTSAPMSYPASPASVCITPRLRKAREEFDSFLAAARTLS